MTRVAAAAGLAGTLALISSAAAWAAPGSGSPAAAELAPAASSPSVTSTHPALASTTSAYQYRGVDGALGYGLAGSDGGVFAFGQAGFFGSMATTHLHEPVVAMAPTPDGGGYWLAAADGGVFSFGDAAFFGSASSIRLDGPVVGMAAAPRGAGYWLVTAGGEVLCFGQAQAYGSASGLHLRRAVVGMAATPDGRGYWLVAADGGVFSFGDAPYLGSAAALALHQPVVGMAATPDGRGYWLVAADGGVFGFGDASYLGSGASTVLPSPVVGMAATPQADGYWLVTATGDVLPFGDAGDFGSAAGLHLNRPVVGMATVLRPWSLLQAPPTAPGGPQLAVSPTSLPAATTGQPYQAALSASGGTAPYRWSVDSGALPPGLVLSSAGVVVGTPNQPGLFEVTVRVQDSSSPTRTTVAPLSVTVSIPDLQSQFTSPNWSGYAVTSGPFSAVSGTFTVPYLQSDLANSTASQWVGLDGFPSGNASLIQAGVDEIPLNAGYFTVQAWWEVLPGPQVPITQITVQPADHVTVQIEKRSAGRWTITVDDDTSGQTFSTTEAYDGPCSSADWVVEALLDGSTQTELAPFAPAVAFSSLSFVGAASQLDQVELARPGAVVVDPSAFGPAGFTVPSATAPSGQAEPASRPALASPSPDGVPVTVTTPWSEPGSWRTPSSSAA